MVDKAIALGLIDVRDIEEVGTGPLMEELGLDEALAQIVVDKCATEAKIVAKEQEEKKAAEAKKKAADRAAFEGAGAGMRGINAEAFANPLLPQNEAATVQSSDESGAVVEAATDEGADRVPGAMEAAEGGAPETV